MALIIPQRKKKNTTEPLKNNPFFGSLKFDLDDDNTANINAGLGGFIIPKRRTTTTAVLDKPKTSGTVGFKDFGFTGLAKEIPGAAKTTFLNIGVGELGIVKNTLRFGEMLGIEQLKNPADTIDNWINIAQPKNHGFVTSLQQGIGSTVPFLLTGGAVVGGVRILGSKIPWLVRAAPKLGAAANTFLESAAEAGSVYEQSIESGQSIEEAKKRGEFVFHSNLALLYVTNRLGIFNDKIKNIIAKGLLSSGMEGIQEVGQQVFSNIANDRPIGEGVKESGLIGAILGFFGGSAIDVRPKPISILNKPSGGVKNVDIDDRNGGEVKAQDFVIPDRADTVDGTNTVYHGTNTSIESIKETGFIPGKNSIFGKAAYFTDSQVLKNIYGNNVIKINRSNFNLLEIKNIEEQQEIIKDQKTKTLSDAIIKQGIYDGFIITNNDKDVGNTFAITNIEKLNKSIRGDGGASLISEPGVVKTRINLLQKEINRMQTRFNRTTDVRERKKILKGMENAKETIRLIRSRGGSNLINEGNSNYYETVQDTGGVSDNPDKSGLYKSPIKLKFKKDGTFVFANEKISSPADVAYAFRQLKNEAVEHFYAVGLKNGKLVTVELISIGTLSASLVHPREVTALLVAKNVDEVYYVHNHPSGVVDPSEGDLEVTSRLSKIHKELGIKYGGHVIIDTDKFGFLAENGDITKIKHKEAAENPKKINAYKKYIEWKNNDSETTTINTAKDVFEVYKGIMIDDKNILVMFLGVRNNILTTQVMPKNKATASFIFKHSLKYPTAGVAIAGENLKDDFVGIEDEFNRLGIVLVDIVDVDMKIKGYTSDVRGQFKTGYDFSSAVNDAPRSGAEQLAEREGLKKQRLDDITERESLVFLEGDLESQYQQFKKLVSPGRLDEIEDVEQLKRKTKNSPEEIDNILYSQEQNSDEVFIMFKERRFNEQISLTKIPKETKAVISEKARRQVKSNKEILDRRRGFIRAVQKQFGLSDNDLKKITRKDIRLMNNIEFKTFIDDIRLKAIEFAETRNAKNAVLDIIKQKQLQRVENLRKAMNFPSINKMTTTQLGKLNDVLLEARFRDVFLTQRQLETVNSTDLAGIKTLREAREMLAKEIGVSVKELDNINVSELDRLRFDSSLVERNPFYKMLAEKTHEQLLIAEESFLNIENEINELTKKARKSRKRSIGEKLIPTDEMVFDYLSGEEELAEEMTSEELELAGYLQLKFGDALEYLVINKVLTKGKENYITNIRRGFLEALKEDSIGNAIKEVFNNQRQDLQIFEILDSETGDILPLEKFFQFSIRRTGGIKPTKNIAKASTIYFRTLEKKKALDAIIPKMMIYVDSLTPPILTSTGLEMDRSLKKFVKEWINNKKGRKVKLIAKQGGKIDIALNSIRSFLYFKDLALNLPVGFASIVGEQVATFVNIGNRKYLKGVKRRGTKQGRKIIKTYKNFIGKNIWESLAEPSKNIGDKFSEGLFVLFGKSTIEANKIHLLGELTTDEFKSGKISDKRLSEMKLEIGRWRMLAEGKSIIGSTAEGRMLTQYKTWAIPILRTVTKNLSSIGAGLVRGDFKKTITSKELREILRAAEVTLAVILLGTKYLDDDDDSFIGTLTKKLYREALTILGALNTKTMLAAPRLVSFVEQLGVAINNIIKLEEYKTKSGYVGVQQLKRELTPRFLKQFSGGKKNNSVNKKLDKIFKINNSKGKSLDVIFK